MCESLAMGRSYPESVMSLQAQTFTSGKASLFVYIGLLGMFWRTWPIVPLIMLYLSDYRHIYISEHSWFYMLQLYCMLRGGRVEEPPSSVGGFTLTVHLWLGSLQL